ncbi:hypothetical protein HII31_13684 [Pseudocercospora fuligena]|uniref:Uncharacterized protein n=1 Tax=Pseudocercospora fuligena TaxID=685502 RepID=A0A8H6R7R5_9PEZI|nr:hypothetical protein HII31_13684 [Pseudocercospora fuligena]
MGYKSLKDSARDNPSQLGDPVSLKAETSKTEPTEQDRPNKNDGDGKTLKQKAEEKLKKNPSAIGDPVSLKAETSDNEPTDQDRGAKSSGKPKI